MAYELQNKCDVISSHFQVLSERMNEMGSTIAQLSEAFHKFAIPNYGCWGEDYLDQLMKYIDSSNVALDSRVNYLENRIIPLERNLYENDKSF